jgi:hypothetical protein
MDSVQAQAAVLDRAAEDVDRLARVAAIPAEVPQVPAPRVAGAKGQVLQAWEP